MTYLSLSQGSLRGSGRWWPGVDGVLPAIVPVAIFLLWWGAAEWHWMSPQVLPMPSLVAETAGELAADNLFSNLGVSLGRLGLGLLAGVGLGAILGVAMGLSRRIEAIVYPTFMAIVQIPTLAWVPLLMMLLGLGEALKIVLIVKAVTTPVAIHTHVGVRDADPKLIEVARVLRLPPLTRLFQLTLPAALPAFMTGVRLGLAQAWVSLVAVELLASSEGIGFLMVWGRQLFQMDVVFVCIIVIGAVGLGMDLLLQQIEPRIVRWPNPAIAQLRGRRAKGWDPTVWILPAAFLAYWSAAAGFHWVDVRLLPAPWTVAATLYAGLANGSYETALGASLLRSLLGLAIGAGAGLGVGLAIGLLSPLNRALSGTMTVLRLVAIFAWLPLITAWAGLGDGAKIMFIAIACFFPMQVATARGVASLSPQLVETARTLRLKPLARLRYLVLPGCAPSIFAGFRLALITSWVAAFGAEYFMAGNGIGSLMINAEQFFRTDTVIAAMILVGATAVAIGALGQAIEARATRWRAA